MPERFTIEKSADDKRWFIVGPIAVSIELDHDDCEIGMEKDAKKLLALLNEHWK